MGKNSLSTHSLAVASGKGGVGKTTTSVNLALHYSRRGMKTVLIDADPLSDIATLLDLSSPEESLGEAENGHPRQIFQMLDLLSLGGSRDPKKVGELLQNLMNSSELETGYDMMVLDLPAGILEEEGWNFIHHIDRLVVVTNDEPTSHVSAGAFIRKARAESDQIPVRIWHNKYEGISRDGFDPKDLPGNYNRNVPEEDRMDFAPLDMKAAAYIPKDPALDLLQASPDLNLNIKRQMLERVELLYRDRIAQVLSITPLSSRLATLLENMLFDLPRIDGTDEALGTIEKDLSALFSGDVFAGIEKGKAEKSLKMFSPAEEGELKQVLTLLKDDNLSRALRRLRRLLQEILEDEESYQRLFYQGTGEDKLKALDREVGRLLKVLDDKAPRGGTTLKNLGGLLLFDFALFKLFGSPTVRKLIESFIPWTEDPRGEKRRDKHSQIRWLVEADDSYRRRYLILLKTLRPAVISQTTGVADVLELNNLLFRKGSELNHEIYLRLLTSFLHDAVNSGLGVIIGFRYRPASRAFQRGAELLRAELEEKDED